LANELKIDENLDLLSGEIYIHSILNVDTQLLKRTMFYATCSIGSSVSSRNSQRTHALNYKEKLRPVTKTAGRSSCTVLSTVSHYRTVSTDVSKNCSWWMSCNFNWWECWRTDV